MIVQKVNKATGDKIGNPFEITVAQFELMTKADDKKQPFKLIESNTKSRKHVVKPKADNKKKETPKI